MANTRDIRRRIKSVKNTAQITRAMQLVAASKMRKAQDQALAGRPYAEEMNKVLVNLRERTGPEDHPLLEQRDGEREIMLVISTDKGLCGPLNTNLLRAVTDEAADSSTFVTVGRKGRQTLARLRKDLKADFEIKDPVHFPEVKRVAGFLIDQFLAGKVDRVKVAFTNFISTLSQEPVIETLLPIQYTSIGKAHEFEGMGERAPAAAEGEVEEGFGYLFEPDPDAVLEGILPLYAEYLVYQMVLEARASEHSARMVAMKNATDNAEQLIKDLTLEYNKLRQAAITNELLEITTAMKALE